jgi:predicted deacylase
MEATRKFALTVELGNEAMQTPADVAGALKAIARNLEAGGVWGYWKNTHLDLTGGNARDDNGNTVGGWVVTR